MAIPLSTVTITVLRPPTADDDAEPYGGSVPAGWDVIATGVPAVIDRPAGTEQLAGGEQSVSQFQLICDPVDLGPLDNVKDDTTGVIYRVVWVMAYAGDHVEAGLRVVRGDI